MAEKDLQPEGLRLPFHAPDQMGIIGVIDLGHHHPDEPAAARAQILRGAIGDVVAAARLGLDARLCAYTNIGCIAKGLRNGHYRQV